MRAAHWPAARFCPAGLNPKYPVPGSNPRQGLVPVRYQYPNGGPSVGSGARHSARTVTTQRPQQRAGCRPVLPVVTLYSTPAANGVAVLARPRRNFPPSLWLVAPARANRFLTLLCSARLAARSFLFPSLTKTNSLPSASLFQPAVTRFNSRPANSSPFPPPTSRQPVDDEARRRSMSCLSEAAQQRELPAADARTAKGKVIR